MSELTIHRVYCDINGCRSEFDVVDGTVNVRCMVWENAQREGWGNIIYVDDADKEHTLQLCPNCVAIHNEETFAVCELERAVNKRRMVAEQAKPAGAA